MPSSETGMDNSWFVHQITADDCKPRGPVEGVPTRQSKNPQKVAAEFNEVTRDSIGNLGLLSTSAS